jgi:hypothetical protein
MPHAHPHDPAAPAAPSRAAAPSASSRAASTAASSRAATAESLRGAASSRAHARGERGQATVELIALLPCLAALLAAVWQLALFGYAEWAASAAARAAARAHAVGDDPGDAARRIVPGSLRRGLRVSAGVDGDVSVALRVPRLPGVPSLGRVHASAHFEPQS